MYADRMADVCGSSRTRLRAKATSDLSLMRVSERRPTKRSVSHVMNNGHEVIGYERASALMCPVWEGERHCYNVSACVGGETSAGVPLAQDQVIQLNLRFRWQPAEGVSSPLASMGGSLI